MYPGKEDAGGRPQNAHRKDRYQEHLQSLHARHLRHLSSPVRAGKPQRRSGIPKSCLLPRSAISSSDRRDLGAPLRTRPMTPPMTVAPAPTSARRSGSGVTAMTALSMVASHFPGELVRGSSAWWDVMRRSPPRCSSWLVGRWCRGVGGVGARSRRRSWGSSSRRASLVMRAPARPRSARGRTSRRGTGR